ncbi:malate--CoA ligase subunit beta [Oceanospirillaceae bacterium]|jgi:succinyl-CoA synthetase beta subunit|nr:malate--CoA ligase subunit beta [Oceanospirillaceae bacterium]MDB9972982.1 malate--CoA ligase subunit beta [Oceanospirillaceae bacterium]
MNIHEYQAKALLAEYGVPIPIGNLAYSPEQATYRAIEIGGDSWLVKAQVHSGARGKAGGIKFCSKYDEVGKAADELLGAKLVTHQTGPEGKICYRLYVEAACNIERELYLAFVLDRARECITVIASVEGGMDIETLAEQRPESIFRFEVEPAVGLQTFQTREIAFALGLDKNQIRQMSQLLLGCYQAMTELDSSMLEINPLAVTKEGQLQALDAKMEFDDNALFRHPRVSELRDKSQEEVREMRAYDRGLSYVGLDGNIGCIINGAGLAMATMDMINYAGGAPANFLDIGGGASPERVVKAFQLVLSDESVEAILVNIFAGINRCDWIAEGVVLAMQKIDIKVPLIVRLSGTNVEKGRQVILDSGLPIILADSLFEAAEKSVNQCNKQTQIAKGES